MSLLQWTTCLLLCTRIHSYKMASLGDDTNQPLNLEIDFFSSPETRLFDDLDNKNFLVDKDLEATPHPDETGPLDSWSVVWYIASFGGLIVFFLIVSCSEWCCRRAIRGGVLCSRRSTAPSSASNSVPDTPPPSYEHFAPPSYESICLGRSGEKREYDIYVVPVHTLPSLVESSRRDDAPPSYVSVETGRVT